MNDQYEFLIVGAGISGLSLARQFEKQGRNFLVVEKSKGVGGRMATRRGDGVLFDHGAQFYKIKENENWDLDRAWSEAGLTKQWFEQASSLYKCAPQGMTSLAKAMIARENIAFEQRVISIHQEESSIYRIECESGKQWRGQKIFLTAPLPQTLEILNRSNIQFPSALANIVYSPALVGLFEVEATAITISEFQHQEFSSTSLHSITNQLSKSMGSRLAFTVVMAPSWSRERFDHNEESSLVEIENALIEKFKPLDSGFRVTSRQLKKWRYSHPESSYSQSYVRTGDDGNIFLLGDAFGGGSIRGACRSAEAVILAL